MRNNVRLYGLIGAVFVSALLCISGMQPAIVLAGPAVDTWQGGWTMFQGSKTGGAVYADTLPRFSGDSVVTTDSFPISAARAIQVHVQGSASDSNAIPILQVQIPGGQWQSVTAASLPAQTIATGTATTLLGQQNSIMLYISGEDAGSGTPVPMSATWGRLRIKSADARRYNAASSATLAPTGTMTYRVFMLR